MCADDFILQAEGMKKDTSLVLALVVLSSAVFVGASNIRSFRVAPQMRPGTLTAVNPNDAAGLLKAGPLARSSTAHQGDRHRAATVGEVDPFDEFPFNHPLFNSRRFASRNSEEWTPRGIAQSPRNPGLWSRVAAPSRPFVEL